ncbi:DUF4251 domain-containing protein [Pedobacter sp. Du54]|uniref:DUF4251 domain-containing protein n=1 Tax=Pedobacter anseongensis TaxID=3133439 RepID=UPI0030B50A04
MKKILILCLLALTLEQASAQATKVNTAQFMDKKTYVFIPTRVSAYSNEPTNLTGYLYFLSVKPDTITTYLPSFGVNGTDGPGKIIDRNRGEYESVKFDYKMEKAKNGSWNISINFKDTPGAIDVRMRLWVNKNGYGTLTVNKTSQPTRTYYGYLKAPEQKSLAR